MGWHNGPPSWTEMERVLTSKPRRAGWPIDQQIGDGGDSPAWSRKRGSYQPLDVQRPSSAVPFAELHAHSAYSFLDGASTPEELVEEAARLDLRAIALTDHDGLYGVVRFAEAAKELDMQTVFGAELSLGGGDRTEEPDPCGPHLLVLARGPEGYRRLSRQLASAHLAGGEKGVLRYDYDALTEAAGGHWHILTGCRKGHVRQALSDGGPEAAEMALADLVDRFGGDRVSVELTHHGHPLDDERNAVLADLAPRFGVGVVATTAAHFAEPSRGRLAMAMGAIRARNSIDEAAGYLAPLGGSHLRSGEEMARVFAHCPEVVTAAADLGEQCAFELALIAPQLPPFDVPDGHTEDSWLRHLVMTGARNRYGPPERAQRAYEQIEHELKIIAQLTFPGYFLVVHDITRFCRENDILAQGRGSAANSAVCYALGVTNVDPVANELLFERFLSPARDGPPDIDIDIESDLREKAIQYVYDRYGRDYAAQVANVITYRGRSAVRDMARALGFSQGQQDAWSKQIGQWGNLTESTHVEDVPEPVIDLAVQISNLPRHMGIHSGGMVICDRPIADVCPVEWARMENRSVLQWDKDDCAAIGLVKFDMLGLGMLSALHYCIDLVAEHKGIDVDLAKLDLSEPAVYEMLQRADSVGVFQVESRAQMATLPRLKPRVFYDLVVEVALIRPGPIQGNRCTPTSAGATVPNRWSTTIRRWRPRCEKPWACRCFRSSSCSSRWTAPASPPPRRTSCAARWGPSGRPSGCAGCAGGSTTACANGTASPATWPTGSTRSSRRSPTSVSRKAIHCLSPRWCSTRRGSSCTIPPRSAPRCCGRSRWASTHRRRWWPMLVGTESPCTDRMSTPAWRTRRWRMWAPRCDWASAASATSVTSWPSRSPRNEKPTGRSVLCWI